MRKDDGNAGYQVVSWLVALLFALAALLPTPLFDWLWTLGR